MRPVVISDSIQEFNGERYYRCGRYFQRKGRRLHRAVWEAHNGPVPDGWHVHHKDNDRSNNAPENLVALDVAEHLGGEHGAESGERGRLSIGAAREAARHWHGTAEGRQWHSQHYELHIRPVMEATARRSCDQCGRSYECRAARIRQSRFCSSACKARALRSRRANAKAGGLLPERS